jgi:hypothetical protein
VQVPMLERMLREVIGLLVGLGEARFLEYGGSSRVISIGLSIFQCTNGCCVGIVSSSPRDVQSYISIVRD